MPRPVVRIRAWIECDGRPCLGPGRAALLEAIARHGSISAAAREVGVTFRTAWSWVRRMQAALGAPLVAAHPGGAGGGGASLTDAGRAALEAWQRLGERAARFAEEAGREVERALTPEARPRRPSRRPPRPSAGARRG